MSLQALIRKRKSEKVQDTEGFVKKGKLQSEEEAARLKLEHASQVDKLKKQIERHKERVDIYQPILPELKTGDENRDEEYQERADSERGPTRKRKHTFECTEEEAQADLTKLSREELVFGWIKKIMFHTRKHVDQQKELEPTTLEKRLLEASHQRLIDHMRPLLPLLEKKKLNTDILDRLEAIIRLCELREYRDAQKIYYLLSIGNAAWPVGMSMFGSHERANMEAGVKETASIAHILSDETTRKYIQSFKRLMTHAQTIWPNKTPSKNC
jgi:hypothetical protein